MGVEYAPEVAALAAERLDRVIATRIEDALPELPDNYFDVIICADVLEHLVDPGRYCRICGEAGFRRPDSSQYSQCATLVGYKRPVGRVLALRRGWHS